MLIHNTQVPQSRYKTSSLFFTVITFGKKALPFYIYSRDVLHSFGPPCKFKNKGLNKGDSPFAPLLLLPPYFELLCGLYGASPDVRSLPKPFIAALSSDNAMQMRKAT